jgi:hypothetical protein
MSRACLASKSKEHPELKVTAVEFLDAVSQGGHRVSRFGNT